MGKNGYGLLIKRSLGFGIKYMLHILKDHSTVILNNKCGAFK